MSVLRPGEAYDRRPVQSMSAFFMQSERLGFRAWSLSDLDLAARIWADPDVTRFIGGPFSVDDVRARLEREIAFFAQSRIQYWPLFARADGAFVGAAGLHPHTETTLELGFHILKNEWGKGYATEAARRVIRHAFDDLAAPALFAGHHPENRDSARVLAKLGFDYTHDELYPPTGLLHPSYSLVRPT